MDYFEELVTNGKKDIADIHPDWVDKNNASYSAWKATELLKGERLTYIKSHGKISHYKTKNKFQITGSEVARKINIAKTTLLATSKYSEEFKKYLVNTNADLAESMAARIKQTTSSKSRGPIARNKDELVDEVRNLQQKLKNLEKENAVAQAEHVLSMLHSDIKDLLCIRPTTQNKNIIDFRKLKK